MGEGADTRGVCPLLRWCALTSTSKRRSMHWPTFRDKNQIFPLLGGVTDAHDSWDDGCGSSRKNYVYNIASSCRSINGIYRGNQGLQNWPRMRLGWETPLLGRETLVAVEAEDLEVSPDLSLVIEMQLLIQH
ncbi:hypothetical protein SUGI_0064840 [Cryptomeria japonica]|nr:hypothetical protein SUGI_0064840 [Cryptomeria japonica]